MKRVSTVILSLLLALFMAACTAAPAAPAPAAPAPAAPAPAAPAPAAPAPAPAAPAPAPAAAPAAEKTFLIGYSSKTSVNDAFQQDQSAALMAAAEKEGVEVAWLQTDTGTSAAQQTSQVNDLISMGCDLIILNCVDPVAAISCVDACNEADIPVINIDAPLDSSCDPSKYVTYIGADAFTTGHAAGTALRKIMNDEGEVIIVAGIDGHEGAVARVTGFEAALEGSNITVVAKQNGEFNNDIAMQTMENLLQNHADADGCYTVSDVMLDGILQAINNHGDVNPNMKIMSIDGSEAGTQFILDGVIAGSVANNPKANGETAIKIACEILRGEKSADSYEKMIDTGAIAITAENAEQYMQDTYRK